MDLLFLHGPPASGKLTIAKEIQRLTGATLFDNHAAIDFARTVFEFGVPPFWDLVHATRMLTFTMAGQSHLPLMVYTTCYSHPQHLSLYEEICDTIAKNGGEILPVFLACDTATREQRVGNADRKSRGKISSSEGLKNFDEKWSIAPVPHPACLNLNSETQNAEELATQIIIHFKLPTLNI